MAIAQLSDIQSSQSAAPSSSSTGTATLDDIQQIHSQPTESAGNTASLDDVQTVHPLPALAPPTQQTPAQLSSGTASVNDIATPRQNGGFLHDIWNDVKGAPDDLWEGLKSTDYGFHAPTIDKEQWGYLAHGEFSKWLAAANENARANMLGVPKSQVVVDPSQAPPSDETVGGKISRLATDPMLGTFHRAGAGPVEESVQKFITGQISPLNIGLAVATLGESAVANVLTKAGVAGGIKAADAALYAERAVKAAKIGTNLYFLTKMGYGLHGSLEGLQRDFKDVDTARNPSEEAAAYNKLKEDGTTAILNSLALAAAAHGTYNEIRPGAPAAALQHADYSDALHENQKDNQVAAAQQKQIAEEFQKVMPDPLRREAAVNYREAAGDTDLLKQREADVRARAAAATTPEAKTQAEALAEGYKAAQNLTPEEIKLTNKVGDILDDWQARLQNLGKLPQGRENYVPHEYEFEDKNPETGEVNPVKSGADESFLKKRTYNTYAEAEENGLIPKRKDLGALTADYIDRAGRLESDLKLKNSLNEGHTATGVPLTADGGYVKGRVVSTERPQNAPVTDAELARLKPADLAELKRTGRIVETKPPKPQVMPFKTMDGIPVVDDDNNPVREESTAKPFEPRLYWNLSDYKPVGLYETRIIGDTPLPSSVVEGLRQAGNLDAMKKSGLIYEDTKGNFFSRESLYGKNVPVYVHPDIAEHLANHIGEHEPGPVERAVDKYILKPSSAIKSFLLSWSPFHKITEYARLGEALGAKGIKTITSPQPIDYFHLTPDQAAGIRDGLVISGTRAYSQNYIEEGLGAGDSKSAANRTYDFLAKGLQKVGVPESVTDKLNLNSILEKNVFGPHGQIARAKFALYSDLKPQLMEIMRKEDPSLSPQELESRAGRMAAYQVNNKFGGLNLSILGRSLQTQKALRALLLAPDFLESTSRSMLDVAGKYGRPLLTKLVQFQIAHFLAARALNYAIHHEEDDGTAEGKFKATHPESGFSVLGTNGKEYGIRSTVADFLHMIKSPIDFAANRVTPLIKGAVEYGSSRNQYGRKEERDATRQVLRGLTPLPFQGIGAKVAPNIYGNSLNEPSAADIFSKAIGVGSVQEQSPAEALAIEKISERIEDKPQLQGQDLLRQQLRIRAEDRLRQAYAEKDPAKRTDAVKNATAQINTLFQTKMIDATQKQKMLNDAKRTRLQSIFTSLSPVDALDVWDQAGIQEKASLGTNLNSKYLRWRESLNREGKNINRLAPEDQATYDRFKRASQELAEIESGKFQQ